MNHAEDSTDITLPLAAFLFMFAGLDLIAPLVMGEVRSVVVAAVPGAVAGQLGLLAAWAVFGSPRLLVRWPVCLLFIVTLYSFVLMGTTIKTGGGPESAKSILFVPLIFLAAQLPLWILKMAIGWRIAHAGTEELAASSESRQFRLQHLFGATTALAVALALARLGMPDLGNGGGSADPSMWPVVIYGCLVCSVWSALAIPSCLWAAFIARNRVSGTLKVAAYAAAMSCVVALAPSAFGNSGAFGEMAPVLLFFNGGMIFVMLGCMHLVRNGGYVLLRAGRVADHRQAGQDVAS